MGESDGTAAEDQLSPAQQLQRDGYLIIRGFASLEECAAMRNAMATLLAEWEPPAAATVFKTDKEQEGAQGEADYFLSSGDKASGSTTAQDSLHAFQNMECSSLLRAMRAWHPERTC
eukprot:1851527-Pleurochrysis_carterae.AAC.3